MVESHPFCCELSSLLRATHETLCLLIDLCGMQAMQFWRKAERVVQYKQQVVTNARKKEVMDKHLDFLVGQTQRYSTLLAQRLAGTCTSTPDSPPCHPMCSPQGLGLRAGCSWSPPSDLLPACCIPDLTAKDCMHCWRCLAFAQHPAGMCSLHSHSLPNSAHPTLHTKD